MTLQQHVETPPLPSDVPADIKHFIHGGVQLAYSPSTGKCYRLLTTKWKLIKPGTYRGTYTQIRINSSMQTLHRIIAQHFLNGGKPLSDTDYVDHREHARGTHQQDILTNLRITNNRGNQANQKRGSSKFAGVHWHTQANKWQARIRIHKQQKHIGMFDSELEAAKAYIETGEKHGYDMTIAHERFYFSTSNTL